MRIRSNRHACRSGFDAHTMTLPPDYPERRMIRSQPLAPPFATNAFLGDSINATFRAAERQAVEMRASRLAESMLRSLQPGIVETVVCAALPRGDRIRRVLRMAVRVVSVSRVATINSAGVSMMISVGKLRTLAFPAFPERWEMDGLRISDRLPRSRCPYDASCLAAALRD